MMDANGQPMGHAYAYYSSGEEDYAAAGVPYGGQVQHQYVMQNPNMDMNQMRPQMQQLQMQHPPYTLQPHPSMQQQMPQQVQYEQAPNVGPMYHHMASTPPPPSPYDPVSPASLSDHSASGTESAGAISARVGGVPIMPARVYHQHSHSHSSQSSTSSLHGEHPYANPHYPASRGHSRTRSVDSRSVGTTPPPGHPHAAPLSDDDDRHEQMDHYVDKISLLNRKESTRRQRIQAEQRRRDELRDGYSRLKEVLPVTTSKTSKVSLIERARIHIIDIDTENATLKNEVEELKKEVLRLEKMSEQLALSVAAVGPKRSLVDGKMVVPADDTTTTSPSVRSGSEPFEHVSITSGSSPMEEIEATPGPENEAEREKTPAA